MIAWPLKQLIAAPSINNHTGMRIISFPGCPCRLLPLAAAALPAVPLPLPAPLPMLELSFAYATAAVVRPLPVHCARPRTRPLVAAGSSCAAASASSSSCLVLLNSTALLLPVLLRLLRALALQIHYRRTPCSLVVGG
jgi:hypothetical protein